MPNWILIRNNTHKWIEVMIWLPFKIKITESLNKIIQNIFEHIFAYPLYSIIFLFLSAIFIFKRNPIDSFIQLFEFRIEVTKRQNGKWKGSIIIRNIFTYISRFMITAPTTSKIIFFVKSNKKRWMKHEMRSKIFLHQYYLLTLWNIFKDFSSFKYRISVMYKYHILLSSMTFLFIYCFKLNVFESQEWEDGKRENRKMVDYWISYLSSNDKIKLHFQVVNNLIIYSIFDHSIDIQIHFSAIGLLLLIATNFDTFFWKRRKQK